MWSRFSRFRLALILVLAVVLTVSLPLWAAEIVILHTNDVHSRLESHIPAEAEEEQGGRVRLATLVDDIRAVYGKEAVILLDAGDSIHGLNVDNLFGGLPSIEVMNFMGYNAFVPGNHDFNYGQEVKLLSRDEGRLKWVAGAFIQRYITDIPPLAFGFNTNNGDQVDFTTPWRKNETGYAIFGQVSYDITDALQLEVGARWNHYEFTQFTNFAFDPTGLGGVGSPSSGLFPLADGFDGNGHKQPFEVDSTDWKVALNYQVNDDHFLYGLISRGHTPGSINLFYPPDLAEEHIAYKEMSVVNYEAGWKGAFSDGRLRTQLNVYYQVFKNYQADFGLEAPGVPASLTTTILQNAKTDSIIYGVEFGFQGRFGDFGIDGGLSYSKSELGNFGRVANERQAFYGGPGFFDLAGPRTPFAPEWTANCVAEYTFHMGGGDGGATLTPRLGLGYRV